VLLGFATGLGVAMAAALIVIAGAEPIGRAMTTAGRDGVMRVGGVSSRACCGGTTGGVGMSLLAGCFGAGAGAAGVASAATVGLVDALLAAS
jgi:hypothetical protein